MSKMHPLYAYDAMQHSTSSKRSNDGPDQVVKRQKTQAFGSMTVLAPQSVPFLELAAEIRNHIYSFVSEHDSTVYIDERGPKKVKSALAIAVLNRQVRREYMSQLSTTKLRATVRDFDFSHVIAFYNQLQASAPHEQADDAAKSLTIVLFLSSRYSGGPSDLLCNEWFTWRNHLHLQGILRGTRVDVKYRATKKSKDRCRHLDTWMKGCSKTLLLVRSKWMRWELLKIMNVLAPGRRLAPA